MILLGTEPASISIAHPNRLWCDRKGVSGEPIVGIEEEWKKGRQRGNDDGRPRPLTNTPLAHIELKKVEPV